MAALFFYLKVASQVAHPLHPHMPKKDGQSRQKN